jgi:lantibiotic transport system ATP-binding protein
LLLGLLRPDEGTMRLAGHPFTVAARSVLQHVGALVEGPSLYSHLTGRENLDVIRRLRNQPASTIDEVLERFEFAAEGRQLVRTYSTGMRQTLALAAACLGDLDLLLLDEPTNGLDPVATRKLRSIIRRMTTDDHVTMFVSTHILAEVEQIADSVGIIAGGRLLYQGSLTELRERRAGSLEDIFIEFVGRESVT